MHTGFWWGKLKEKDNLEDPGIDERVIAIWIFSILNRGGVACTALIWLTVGAGGVFCACGIESWGSIQSGEFLDYLRTG